MARSGMTNLIAELRLMTNAGTAEYSIGASTYFSDDTMQASLDRTAQTLAFALLDVHIRTVNGQDMYTDYDFKRYGKWFEETTGGTAGFVVRDENGIAQGTSIYSVNYQQRLITFNGGTVSTGGSAYYLDATMFDLHGAAADVWRQRAAYYGGQVDWRSDNHDIKTSQRYAHAMQMVEFHERQATTSVRSTRFYREDERTGGSYGRHGYDVEPDWRYISRWD